MFTNAKITIAGNIIETYDFENELWHGKYTKLKRPPRRLGKKAKNGVRSESSFFRSKNKLKHLIDANVVQTDNAKLRPRFITFTFRDNLTDIKTANSMFTKFIRKFNRFLKFKNSHLKYVTVIEFQKRGAVHYHSLFFNLPYFKNMYDEMERLWGNGWVISKKIDKVKHLSSYVCKYMSKKLNDERLYGQKCYFASMNLTKPRTIYNESAVRFVAEFMPDDVVPYERIIQTNGRGAIVYRRYDMTKHQDLKNDLLAFIK